MSLSQDEIRQFNTPSMSTTSKKGRGKNRIRSPPDQSPASSSARKPDVFELFTVKKARNSDSRGTSELSDDDVFVEPKAAASTPSTRSYREKINERFRNVKERAGKSAKKADVFKEVAEKILLEKIRRESGDVDAELDAMRNRLKLGKAPEKRDLYEFFASEKRQEAASEKEEDKFESTDDLTGREPEMRFSLPQQLKQTLKNSEKELFFKPNSKLVDLDEKLESEEPRYMEDEGFYVAPKPKIPSQQLNLLEQRLSRDSKKWFDCEGKLNIMENPCQKTSYRPWLKSLPTCETTMYLPATTEDQECEEIVVIRENLLRLQISTLKFNHHPLFSLEHVLERRLRTLCDEYEESQKNNNLTRLKSRLDGLRRVFKRLEENSSQSGYLSDREEEKISAYKRDIRILQNQLFEEGKIEKDRLKAILATWKSIKKLRESNKYSNTSIKLLIKKEQADYDSDKENFDRNFEQVFEELSLEKSRRKRYNEEEMREDLLERFRESFRMPGEPILDFVLTEDNDVSKNVDNPKENDRRNAVASTKIILKIICNKMEVCRTNSVSLQDNFICNFDQTIAIQLVTIPKQLTIEIIEQSRSLIKRSLGDLTIKLPSKSSFKNDDKAANFVKNEIVYHKHEGVGSGCKLDAILENGDQELHTSGCLFYSLKWDNPVGTDETSEENQRILDEIIDKNGSIRAEKLSQWMHQSKPDPQDPRNSILFEYFPDCEDDLFGTSSKEYFRLNPHLDKWQFCDPKLLEDNLRLKVLQLRNRNEPEFDRMTVPNRIREIPLDIMNDYKRRLASENETVVEEDDDEDEIETRRSRGKKRLKQIHIRVFQKCKNSDNNLTFEDVVDEKFLHHFQKLVKGLAASFVGWFRWRPLKPPPLTAAKAPPSDYDLKTQAKVVVTVVSALNVPQRVDGEVAPFVEAEHNDATATTSTGQGAHPSWGEKLILPLEPSHMDYLNPHSLNGTITLNLFDEIDRALTKFPDGKSRNWLGGLEIPLSAICYGGIQGMFKVKIPNLLLGYKERDTSAKVSHTYLNLQIEIEPIIPKLSPSVEELPCVDLPYIREHILKWNESYNISFPNRKFSVFAIDANANTACIVRYVRPLEPPQINVEGFDMTPEQCARYVSLIPFTDCNQFYKNIWLSVERFLHFTIGSIIDHALALTCYLLALKKEAWLLLGFGLPYGSTAFVLVKEHDNNRVPVFYIFDVVHGEKINLTDPFCPLQKVYCLINEHNIWGNIQRNDDVTLMSFDLSRKSDWLPLFNNKIPAPTNSVHGKLTYLPPFSTDELEIVIDRKIRKRIAKLRQLDRTIWNHQISNAAKSVLNKLEKREMHGKNVSDALEKIRECVASYTVQGHVFCSPFSDVSTIVKKIKAYGLHLQDDDEVQFASAVYVKSYPNQVLAVWIFLAAIKTQS